MQPQTLPVSPSRAVAEAPPMAVVAIGEATALPVDTPAPATASTPAASEDAIRELAYALYEARGCVDGHDLEDWLKAEAQVARPPKPVPA